MIDISNALGDDGLSLIAPHRSLRREGPCIQIGADGRRHERYCFCFSDMLLLAKDRSKVYAHVRVCVCVTSALSYGQGSGTRYGIKRRLFLNNIVIREHPTKPGAEAVCSGVRQRACVSSLCL